MLSITLQTNSITFLSGIWLHEIVFELVHSAFAWDTQLYRVLFKTCENLIIKYLKHEVMTTPTGTTWAQIVNDFWDLWKFPNFIAFFIVRLYLCLGRMKECNVRLICIVQLSWMLS